MQWEWTGQWIKFCLLYKTIVSLEEFPVYTNKAK